MVSGNTLQTKMSDVVPDAKLPADLRRGSGAVPQEQLPQDLRQQKTPKTDPNAGKLGGVAGAVTRMGVEGVMGALTFVPDIVTDVVNLVPESVLGPKTRSLGDRWESILDKYVAKPETTAGKVGEFAGSALLGGGIAHAVTKALKPLAKHAFNKITTRAAEEVSKAGYKLSPSYIGGDISRTVQSMSGGPKFQKSLSAVNERVSDRLAAAELGYHGDIDMSPEFFEDVKAEAYVPYEEARALGVATPSEEFFGAIRSAGSRFATLGKSFGGKSRWKSVDDAKAPYLGAKTLDANDLVDEMKNLRAMSNANFKVRGAGADEARALAYTQREMATAMEKQLDRMAGSDAKLSERLTASRKQLSKIMLVEDSLGAGGHVRASDILRAQKAGAQLTGGLKTIATMAEHFKNDVQQVSKYGESGEFSVIDYLVGGSGLISGHPGTFGLVVARPLARHTLGTKRVQKSMLKGMKGEKSAAKAAFTMGVGIEGYHDIHEFSDGD
jgi:hypothetical protein